MMTRQINWMKDKFNKSLSQIEDFFESVKMYTNARTSIEQHNISLWAHHLQTQNHFTCKLNAFLSIEENQIDPLFHSPFIDPEIRKKHIYFELVTMEEDSREKKTLQREIENEIKYTKSISDAKKEKRKICWATLRWDEWCTYVWWVSALRFDRIYYIKMKAKKMNALILFLSKYSIKANIFKWNKIDSI